MVEIKEVLTKSDLKKFVQFPVALYKDNPYYIPDLLSDEMANFNKDKNPAYSYCDTRCFLAYKDGEIAGRIAAIHSKKANEVWNTRRLRFSRIDFIDDIEVSAALLQSVEQWARELGMDEVHGPIGFSDMDQQGMLIEGFDQPSMLITIYNHEYYQRHMQQLGYGKSTDWVEYRIEVPDSINPRFIKLSEAVLKRSNVRVMRPNSKKEIKQKYIDQLFNVLNASYSGLYGVVPLMREQIDKYADEFLQMINLDFVRLLLDENDTLVGFGLGIPSLNEAVKKSNGRLFPFGWYRLLRAPHKKSEVLDLYLVGVVPEMQSKGMTAILLSSLTKEAIEKGIKYAETGPELEDNHKVQSLWKEYNTEQHKRRRCWIKNID